MAGNAQTNLPERPKAARLNVPSCCADTLIQKAGPLWAGGGGAFGPGGGAEIGATGIAESGSSVRLAINMPGTVYSWPLSCEK